MALFALADLHLSFSNDKPMDIFGEAWKNHSEKIEKNWRTLVAEEDTVIVPGDISWAKHLEDVVRDLAFIHALPGTKILSKGNHDYWWSTVARMERLVAEQGLTSLHFMKNNAFLVEDAVVCGAKGWMLPTDPDFGAQDRVIYEREKGRLQRSLEEGRNLMLGETSTLVAALHYPPLIYPYNDTEITKILEDYRVDICVYGHLHGAALRRVFEGERNGVEYRSVSADYVDFTPIKLI